MSYHTPTGWRERAAFRDKRLPHQIRIDLRQGGGSPVLIVRCNCTIGDEPLAEITTAEDALQVYRAHEWRAFQAELAGAS